jgi:hypothetical protein
MMVAVSDLVVTVAVSAAVSGLVALAIEYAAKPRLEARKEELLELHRRRRELKAMLLKITPLRNLVIRYFVGARAVYLSEMPREDMLRILGEMSEPLQVGLAGRWPMMRGGALARLPEVLDKFAPLGSAGSEPRTAEAGNGVL